jgi:class 3 adenylate cyclase/tetratricopeptide (TPR) repeat protein
LTWACPVCFCEGAEPVDVCPACGSDIAGLSTDSIPVPESAAAVEAPESPDDLAEVFRAQFERHEVRLPLEWIERLRRLAADAHPARRMATVLFLDLCGYSRLTEVLTTAQHDELLARFFGVCVDHVERNGGFIVRLMGDCVYAAFGAPWALERDSEAALKAALGIREELAAWPPFHGHVIQMSAGAAMGIADVRILDVQGRRTPDLFGTIVNLASRLQGAAGPGEILVSDALHEQTAGVFDFEEGEEFLPKNFSARVRPYRVLAHRGDRAVRRRGDLPFVGRGGECALVEGWFRRAAAGEFVSAWIAGEAGIGKSRLLAEALARGCGGGLETVQALAEPSSSWRPLAPVMEWLERLAGSARTPETRFEALGRRLVSGVESAIPAAAVSSLGYLLGVEPHASQLRGLRGSELREQVVGGLAEFLAHCARGGPLALVLDDAQWADPMSRDVLGRLEITAPRGLLLLRLTRNDDPALPSGESADRMTLGPIDNAARLALLGHLLELERLHPLQRARLLRDAEANPLQLIALGEAAADGLGRPGHSPAADDDALPGSLLELLQARIDRLEHRRKAILQCGAVIGSRFGFRLVSAVREAEEDLLSELFALRGLDMLRAREAGGDIEFQFHPSLLREVSYRMMTEGQRAGLHEQVAASIERRLSHERRELAWELAFHWQRAGRLDRARPYIIQATRRALAVGGSREALELVGPFLAGTGSDVLPGGDARRIILQQRALLFELAGRAARTLGEESAATGHFESFLALARELGHAAWTRHALHELAWQASARGAFKEATLLLGQIDAQAGSALALDVMNTRGVLLLHQGRHEEAREAFESVLATAPGSGPPPHALTEAVHNLGLVHHAEGRLEEALARFGDSLELKQASGDLPAQVLIRCNIAMILEQVSTSSDALAAYDEALAAADSCGYLAGACAVQANRANILLQARRWDEAARAAGAALHLARQICDRRMESLALENLGMAQAGLGFLDEAARNLWAASEIGASIRQPHREHSPVMGLAWVLLLAGSTAESRQTLGLLPADPPPDIAEWRRQALSALAAFESGDESEVPTVNQLLATAPPATPREPWERWVVIRRMLSGAGAAGELDAVVARLNE